MTVENCQMKKKRGVNKSNKHSPRTTQRVERESVVISRLISVIMLDISTLPFYIFVIAYKLDT